jgi:hypothetical protein
VAGLATALWEATLGELEQRLDAGRAALERGEVWTFEEVRLPGVPLEPELAPRARLEGRVEMRMGEVVSQLLAESAARPGPAHSAGAGAERPTPAFVDRLA